MAEPTDDDTGATPASPLVGVVPPLQVENPKAADRFLKEHDTRRAAAASDFDSIMKQRQDAVDRTRSILDQTISDMRVAHKGSVNLPLLAFGAGMLSAPEPGVASNFGKELGAGLKGAGAAIQHQRMSDQDFLSGIAQLQAKQGELADVPLKDAAALAKAKEIQEGTQTGAIEKAIISSKQDQAKNLGGGIIQMPDGRIVNAYTKEEIDLSKEGNDSAGKSLIGSTVHGDDFLKTISSPALRENIKAYSDYTAQMPTLGRSPQAMAYMQDLLAKVKQFNPDFDAKNYPTIQKAMGSWVGQGANAVMQRSVTATGEHMGNLQSAAAGLNNSDFTLINKAGNLLKAATGSPRIAAFLAAKQAVMTEMSAFLGKGHPAEGQILAWNKTVDEANSPAALQAALEQYASIMHGQAVALARNKTNDLHKEFKAEDIYGPETTKRLQSVLSNDIATTGGRFAALRRGQNDKLTQLGQPALPTPTQEQWEKGIAILKKNPATAAQFDERFGPGSAKMVLGGR